MAITSTFETLKKTEVIQSKEWKYKLFQSLVKWYDVFSLMIFTKYTLISPLTIKFQAANDKTDIMACAASKESDQPGDPSSLIRVFAVRMKKAWILSYPLSAQRRLWSDWADAQVGFRHAPAQLILFTFLRKTYCALIGSASQRRFYLLPTICVSKQK